VAKAELGAKRRCLTCASPFFDLNRTPIVCPKCNAVFRIVEYALSRHKWAPSPPTATKKPAPTDPTTSDLVLPEVEDTGEENTIPPIDDDEEIPLEEIIEIERDGVTDA
jgi:uncharacterized protein (TIGR02300 family)